MFYKSDLYQLKSPRYGMIQESQMLDKVSIFFTLGEPDSKKLQRYSQLNNPKTLCIAIPFEGHGCVELTEYEKILGTDFIITNPIDHFHPFFEDFALPFQPYTEYHFSDKLQFESKQIYQ